MKNKIFRILFRKIAKKMDRIENENYVLTKRDKAIQKFIGETCLEFKKKYHNNTAILVFIQKVEESITWVNPYLKQKHNSNQ